MFLYNIREGESIDDLYVKCFMEEVTKSTKYFEAKSLPPTKAATKFRNPRVYYQIQEWKARNQLKPEESRWQLNDGNQQPIKTGLPTGPADLLAMIRCKCTTGC